MMDRHEQRRLERLESIYRNLRRRYVADLRLVRRMVSGLENLPPELEDLPLDLSAVLHESMKSSRVSALRIHPIESDSDVDRGSRGTQSLTASLTGNAQYRSPRQLAQLFEVCNPQNGPNIGAQAMYQLGKEVRRTSLPTFEQQGRERLNDRNGNIFSQSLSMNREVRLIIYSFAFTVQIFVFNN